ncbi:MAG: site-specific integrase, partial [Proteobacteria bacterium]|nr:site-specific integrase [Pseudomonadota bacterium]
GKRSEEALLINGRAAVQFFGPETPMRSIDERKLAEYTAHLKKLGNANGTINRKLAALSKMFHHAIRLRMLDRKPFIKKEREPVGRIRYLTKSEEDVLIEKFRSLGYRDYADLCTVLVDTGARVGEILKAQWKDVNGRILSLWDTKNGCSRSVPLTTRASEVLETRRGNGQDGPFSKVSQNSFNHTWTRVKNLLGMGDDTQFVPHVLRHTCASRLVQAGVPILSVKEYLGHKSMTVTLRYAHLAPKQLWQAMEVLERGQDAA